MHTMQDIQYKHYMYNILYMHDMYNMLNMHDMQNMQHPLSICSICTIKTPPLFFFKIRSYMHNMKLYA